MVRTFLLIAFWLIAAALAGCNSPSRVTFNRDIAPIVFAKCAACHRPGEAAPFSLLSYDDARDRAGQIAEVTTSRFMPPWLPKPEYGEFVGARRLTDQEVELFAAWAAAGAPEGAAADLLEPPWFTLGWQLGEPDLLLESPPFDLPAGGGDRFRNFVLSVPKPATGWVKAIELRPENPRVSHHARLGIDASNESVRRDADDDGPGYEGMAWGADPDGQLVTWTPGMQSDAGMAGAAWRLPPGANLVLHTHMQPSGKQERVRFRVGVHFAEGPPSERPVILRVGSRDIDVPAGEANHVVVGQYQLPIDVDLQFVFPHAHSLCHEIQLTARFPGGAEQTLIWIEHFDENWHDKYRYASPVRLPAGTRLVSQFRYDNTTANAGNPHNPPQRVVYGSNADDEMSDIYLQVTPVDAAQRAVLLEHYEQTELRSKIVGYRKTLELHSDDRWSREGLASCFVAVGQPQQAIQTLEARPELVDSSIQAKVILAMAQLATGDAALAEGSLRGALERDDRYALAWIGLGQALVARQQVEPAEQAYRRAVELAPRMTVARLDLADLLIAEAKVDDAATVCEAAIESSPDDHKPYLKLAAIRAQQRRYDESLQLFAAARRLAPFVYEPQASLAIECYQLGDEAEAARLLLAAEKESPGDPVPQLFLGQIARRDGELSAARRQLDAAATLPPPNTWPASHRRQFYVLVHKERLQLAQQLEDPDLARDAALHWLEYDPENAQLKQLLKNLAGSESNE